MARGLPCCIVSRATRRSPSSYDETVSGTGSAGGGLRQVTLGGDDAPFDVTDDLSLPLRVVAQGPPFDFELPVEVAETVVPDVVRVLPLVRFGDPALRAVRIGDMLYAGRVAGSALEATVFSFAAHDGPQIGPYLYEGDLPVAVASAPPAGPGIGRARVGPPEGNVDVVFFGLLDRDVAVVVLEVDGRPVAAVRPRARFAVFDTHGVPWEAALRLVAHGSAGDVVHEEVDPGSPRPMWED